MAATVGGTVAQLLLGQGLTVLGREAERAPRSASPRPDWPDAQLVEAFRGTGCSEAYEILVRRHQSRVFRLILASLGPGHAAEAEEIAQEVFAAVFLRLSSLRQGESFESWLNQMAYRKAVDHRRTPRFHRPHEGEEALARLPAGDRQADPLERLAREQEGRLLATAIEGLAEPQPAILRLHYWLGWSVEAIANAIDVPAGTVKSHLFRARQRLHAALSHTRSAG
ncbi:MAG TPA: sigma-70 family RNA polymerase sigma factor [Thermoanaerobaculia bacterium]|nr:sigma-70 family RNA polymerase sigma factor [Thermoanaerobaculia bacterium]